MKCKIRKCDHTGDSVLAEFDTDNKESVKVAQDSLTNFLNECVKQHGSTPPVWARKSGSQDFSELKNPTSEGSIMQSEEILVHPIVVGG